MITNIQQKNIWIGIIGAIALSLFCFEVFAQSPTDIEQRANRLEQQLQGTTNLNNLMETYREAMELMGEANRKTGGITGTQTMSVQPAETPEKEMDRRREIINNQFRQIRDMRGNLPAGEEKPQIPEAVPVEGYIFVNGGEKELFYNQVKTDLLYTIKESFVGNLAILHTYGATREQFDREKDYEIQSLSTKVDVTGVAGKKCTRWSSGSPSVCTRWAHFLRYEIDKGERYPQFYAGVVSATPVENGRIKVEASAPKVIFRGDDGKTNLMMGCFNATWTLSKAEFEKFLKQGEMLLRQDIGRPMGPSPGCCPGSTMTLYLKVREKPAEECKDMRSVDLIIVSPQDKSRHVFSDEYLLSEHSNKLTLELEARTVPERYADSVEWTIPEIEGSNRTIIPASTSSTPKGRKLTVVYKGLPEDNNQFGRKTVKATLKVDSCRIEKTREVRLFYPRDEKNNPEGKYPNWFYYWKQTPAARPFGQNVRIEYHCTGIPIDKCACLHRGVIGQYNPHYSGYKTINVCNLKTNTWDPDTFYAELPAVKRAIPSTLSARNFFSYTYIDTFAIAIMHEFTHFNNFHTFWPGGWISSEDADADDIPDRLESEMGFRPGVKQTYWEGVDLGGDEEFLTLESTYDYQAGTYDEYDWARPGKNWPK